MFLRRVKYFGASLTAVLFCLSLHSFAQKVPDYKKRRFTFHIERLDTSISFEVCAVNPKVVAKESSSYSWYLDDKILQTRGGFSGRLLHGRYTSFYGNKNLRERGTYIKGRKEGKWMKWNSDGKINEVSYWRMGVKQGKYVLYNDMGQRMLSGRFKKDKLNGNVSSYEKDKVISKVKYRNGTEVPLKISKGKTKDFDERQRTKPSFGEKLKSIFKRKEKKDEVKPSKEKKKTTAMTSIQ
jgi:hypothetical protein